MPKRKRCTAFDRINAETKVFGLIGDPVAHSHSPLVHNAAFRKAGINAVYLPFRVPPELLDDTLEHFDRLKFNGYSVTIPHKVGVMEKGVPNRAAGEIGAANTLFRLGADWQSTNTDYSAAMESLQAVLDEQPEEHQRSIEGRKVLILGTGGVGRAVAFAMARKGAAVVLSNRTRTRGEALASEIGCQYTNWENRGGENAEVVINCTSVGMHPKVDETPYEEHWFRDNAIAFDTVYTPETHDVPEVR